MIQTRETLTWWVQKVLPLVYEDSLSHVELLSKVVDYLNQMILNEQTIDSVLTTYGGDINLLKTDVDFLQAEMEKVRTGNYVSLYLDSLGAWIDNNLTSLVAKIVKYVSFELDENGYFVAYIPDTWDFLKMDTVMDINDSNYGHLIIEW
jgi:hypothetical protein